MSEDVIHIACTRNKNSVEIQIALQCAPLLAGYKTSNMLIVKTADSYRVGQILSESSIMSKIIFQSEKKTIFLLYNEQKLNEYLQCMEIKQFFYLCGYREFELQSILNSFSERYTAYTKNEIEFPHEMGLILGYPPEDVKGFIENNGKNFLYAGYWKVYGNLSEKLERFRAFDMAKENIVRMVAAGISIASIIDKNIKYMEA